MHFDFSCSAGSNCASRPIRSYTMAGRLNARDEERVIAGVGEFKRIIQRTINKDLAKVMYFFLERELRALRKGHISEQ